MGYKDRGKIKRIADERGVTPRQLVDQAIAEHGSAFKAAVSLGVFPNTLRWWTEEKQKSLALRAEQEQSR